MGYATAWEWVRRSKGRRLDQLKLQDRPSGCPRPRNRVSDRTEGRIIRLRRELKEHSSLGEYGASAIRRAMIERRMTPVPSVRTIGRVLSRKGQLDARLRVRRPPPPPGWHLPLVAKGKVELDSFDAVEGLKIKGGPIVESLNGVSLHSKLVASWPVGLVTAKIVVRRLVQHWKRFGLPRYAQFDNDTIFQGAHQFPDSLGRVARLCLSLGVTPVFAPPREHGLQNQIESYNNLWQRKVWHRFEHANLKDLITRSDAYVLAHRRKTAAGVEAVPRRKFPKNWVLDLDQRPAGRVIFIRRTNDSGEASLLGHTFAVDRDWPGRLVRAEVDLKANMIEFFRLRKRDPENQPLLRSARYTFPQRKFHH